MFEKLLKEYKISYVLILLLFCCSSAPKGYAENVKIPFELIGSWQMHEGNDFSHEFDTIWGKAQILWYWPPNSFYFDYINEKWVLILAESGTFSIEEFKVIDESSYSFYFKKNKSTSSYDIEGWVTFHFINQNVLWIEQEEPESIFSTTNFKGKDFLFYKLSKPSPDFISNGKVVY